MINLDLNEAELRVILIALQHAQASPGFKYKLNPMPWVLEFEAVLVKIEGALK